MIFINIYIFAYTLLALQIRDVNELSRQEVDEVINMCARQNYVSATDDIQRRLLVLYFLSSHSLTVNVCLFYILHLEFLISDQYGDSVSL